MKLQFKTDDLLKKVEGLIIKDVAARKEHNRKVDIVKGKVDEYIAEKTAQRQSEIEKAKAILAKYSDDELKEMFLEEHTITSEGVLSNYKRETLKERKSVTIEGVEFGTISYEGFEELRPLKYKACFKRWLVCDEFYYKDVEFSPVPKNLTKIPEVLLPWKIEEKPSKELTSLKDICLQAKSHKIGTCILDNEDLKVLSKYENGENYSTKVDIHRLIYSTDDAINWADVIDVEGLL